MLSDGALRKKDLNKSNSSQSLFNAKALPPFAALRAFEAVGRLKGVRRAAESLSLHHGVVSRHLRMLEDWLGVPLMERTGRSPSLTDEGRKFHARISDAIADIADATAEIMQAGQASHLSLWTNGGFAAKWLGPQLVAFNASNPGLFIDLRPTDARPDLLRNEADIDIRYFGDAYSAPPGGRSLRHVDLARPPIVPVASPAVAEKLAGAEVSSLLSAPLIHEENDAQWRAWLSWHGVHSQIEIPGPRLWHAHLAVDAAIKGHGIALVNVFVGGEDLANGKLVELSLAGLRKEPAILGSYAFTTREERWSTPAYQRLRRWLQEAVSRTLADQAKT